MKPGPELDRLVAEKVLGWVWRRSRETGRRCLYDPKGWVPEWMDQPADGSEPLVTVPSTAMVPSLPLSSSLSTMEAAAEDARKTGKILGWTVSADSSDPEDPLLFSAYLATRIRTGEVGWRARPGDTPAHALALAVLRSCGGE